MGLMQTKFFTRALALPAVVAILKRVVPPVDRFLLRVSRGWVNTALPPVALFFLMPTHFIAGLTLGAVK